MKRFGSFILILISSLSIGQETLPIMKGENVCWLGVDFSIAKFVGAEGFTDPDEIKKTYFNSWNSLLIDENRVTVLEKGLKFESLSYNTDNVKANNAKIEMNGYIQEETHDVSRSDVKSLIDSYDYSEIQEKICVSIVVESFDKLNEVGEVWMAFNFLSTGKQFLKKLEIKPKGFGFRNYWLGVLKEAIIITDNKQGKWYKGKG